MKHIFFISSLCLWAHTLNAQIITVYDNDIPVEGIVIMSNNQTFSVVTNSLGQADISSLQNSDKLIVLGLGYKTLEIDYETLLLANAKIELVPQALNLEQIIVSGTRWRQSSDQQPLKVSTINAKEIQLQNPQTAADLLGLSSKVFIQKSQQGGGSPIIRGFATNRLIYTVDGVRMNTAIFRSGNIQNVINLDPFATANAEVLFGPGSVIYGSDAIGGAMAFQTLRPQLSTNDKIYVTGKVNSRYSSANDEKTGHIDINLGWKKWALVTSVSKWNFDHLKQGSHGPNDYIKKVYVARQGDTDSVLSQTDSLLQIPSAYSQLNIMQKIYFRANDNWDFQYGFHYSKTSDYGRYDRHLVFKNNKPRYAEWNYGPQSWLMHQMSVHHNKKNKWYDMLSLRLAFQKFEESRIDRNFNSLNRRTQTENVDAYSINVDFIKALGPKHTLMYGLEYVLNDVVSSGNVTDISKNQSSTDISRYPLSTWNSGAFYINDEYKVNERWTLQAGVRYNLYTLHSDFSNNQPFISLPFNKAEIQQGALTGSLGTVFRPNESVVFRVNAGTAFRSPNVDDIGKIFAATEGFVTVPNPDLKAEYAYTLDFGVSKVFGEWIKADVSVFYTYLQDALVIRNYQLNGADSLLVDGTNSRIQAIQNAAKASVYGIQASLEVKLGKGFSVLTDWNYQKGEEELNDASISPSRHAAPLFGSNRLRYVRGQLTLEINSNHQAERSFEDLAAEEQVKSEIYAKDSRGKNYAPAWYTLNFKGMVDVTKAINVTCGVENITDQRYRPYSSGISGAGRNFVLGLRYKF